jgi:hypothetical protein
MKELLAQVAYIGHWVHHGAIVRWHNHESIVPMDLFMYAYNRLSKTDFYGDPNPDYKPYRTYNRHKREERGGITPTYSQLLFTDDLERRPHAPLSTSWSHTAQKYHYQLQDYPWRSLVWSIKCFIADALVDRMLLERLKATTIDEAAWQEALNSTQNGDQGEIRRLEASIRQAEQTKDNIIAGLGTLTHPQMVERAQARYENIEHEIASLTAELDQIKSGDRRVHSLVQARPVLEKIVAHWDDVPQMERRHLFEASPTTSISPKSTAPSSEFRFSGATVHRHQRKSKVWGMCGKEKM